MLERKVAMGNKELTEIKSEIKTLKKRMIINVMKSDAESVEKDFYAIMDGYNRMRTHIKNSVTQCEDICSEVEVVE